MKTFVTVVAICALIIISVYACTSAIFQTIHVRYRLTVEVNVGDQVKASSGVIEVSYPIFPDSFVNLDGPNNHPRVVGYAITVDLGERGLLFLTFAEAQRSPDQRRSRIRCTLDDIGCLAFAAYRTGIGDSYSQQKTALNDLLGQSGPRDVPFTDLPELVRFLDINDPTTLVPVSPFDLAASFGPGVKLSRVILELTDSAETPEPEIWPDWLKIKKNETQYLEDTKMADATSAMNMAAAQQF